jgi:Argonaute siRNA chaperone (ARC) complex subunit Arb1
VPQIFTIDTVKEVKECSAVIRNFLNYVLSHSVCPEYTQEIMAARKICDLAEVELPLIRELGNLLPGDFNTAASTLYGGYYNRFGVQNSLWVDDDLATDPQRRRRLYGMPIAEAERIFKTAIAFLGTWEHYQCVMKPYEGEVKSMLKSIEVVEIVLATPEMRKKYAGVKDLSGDAGNFQPLGVLKVKHWDNPDGPEEDTSDDGQSATETPPDSVIDEFWLESHILEKCFVGMKFEATVHELSIGIKYFDVVNNIYCSFFTYLPSSRLDGWKPPVLNERLAPTVDDADDNDGQQEGEKEDSLD